MKTIGFIGLGIMGKPMSKNLLKAGYPLVVYDINPEAVDEICAAGAKKVFSPKEAAQNCDLLITMLPNSPHVSDVLFGENGAAEGMKSGMLYIDMSSINPLCSREISEKLIEKGIIMLDAPVSGGEPKAIDGTLSIMVGGPEKAFSNAVEVLKIMGASVVHVGEIGSGNIAKLANQVIVALNIAAVSEGLVLAAKAGADPEKVYNAIKGGLAGSTVLNAKGPMILDRNFNPGFRIELHIKDLLNAVDTAHDVGAPLPLTSQVLEMMQVLQADGLGACDHSALVQYFENLAKVEVRKTIGK